MTAQTDRTLAGDMHDVKTGWFEHGTSRIYYEDSGTGEAMLLIPGFAGSIAEYSAVREAFVSAGYRVITADIPGSGRSQPQPRAYTVNSYDEDARAFAALLNQLGAAPAHLMGFSDGGEISLLLAALIPDIARSVVAWGAVGVLSDPTGQFREAMYNVVDNPIPPMQGFSEYLHAAYGAANARIMTRSAAGVFGEIIEKNGGDISRSKAGSIACPVFLIAGEHDFFATPALISELAAQIRTVKTLIVEGAGHDPLHNSRADWFAQTVLDWLKKR
ncbi:MAG: alpha/beta hydrolase [Chloroflexota bacterium]